MVFRAWIIAAMSAALVSGGVSGCASGPKTKEVGEKISAKEKFEEGQKLLKDEDYMEALDAFNLVKSKFPYSIYAAEADVLIADCDYGREKYIEAADSYANFIKMHPKHPKVPYARFRIAMSYVQRIPDDWWFAPPAYELDQSETLQAISELERFLSAYPEDDNVKEARKQLDQARMRMARMVRYVMKFYVKRQHHRGALWRADELLTLYAGLGFDEEALFCKCASHIALDERDAARAALEDLIKRFPKGSYAVDARKMHARLPAAAAPARAAPAPAAPAPVEEPASQSSEQPAPEGDDS